MRQNTDRKNFLNTRRELEVANDIARINVDDPNSAFTNSNRIGRISAMRMIDMALGNQANDIGSVFFVL